MKKINDKRFLRLLKIECRKSVINRMFLVSLGIGLLFSAMSAIYMIRSYLEYRQESSGYGGNNMGSVFSLYNHWIGGEWSSYGFQLFFMLLPLLSCIPYGWSVLTERTNGYVMNMAVRAGKKAYYLSKYAAVFLSGGIVVSIPLILNFITVALFVPAIVPDANYIMYFGNDFGSMWSQLFYTHPLVYCLLYMILDFVFGGLFACMSMAAGMILENRAAVVISPFLILLGVQYGKGLFGYQVYAELSPINFLHASYLENPVKGYIVILWGIFILTLTLGMVVKAGVKSEIHT